MAGTSVSRIGTAVRRQGVHLGENVLTQRGVLLSTDWFESHVEVIGPTGFGKTRLVLWMFRQLLEIPDAAIIVLSPKGDCVPMARDFAIAAGYTDRLLVFDPGDPEYVMGYNPLKPSQVPVHEHAKSVREALLSAWGQTKIDQTPQLARYLYLALAIAREQSLTLVEAADLLRPGSALRSSLLPRVRDSYLRSRLAEFHALKETRQDEIIASTLARLDAFVMDPAVRHIVTQREQALDIDAVMQGGRILLMNLEINRPLREDDVRLLGRLFVNDLVAHVFARPPQQRRPVFLIIDEVQTFATPELCRVLDQTRELRLGSILVHHNLEQLELEDESRKLVAAVCHNAVTKVVFGGGWIPDLAPLVEHLFLDQFDPKQVKDEITTLECEPVEETRVVPSFGTGVDVTRNEAFTRTSARQRSRSVVTGEQEDEAETEGEQAGETAGAGASEVVLPSGDVLMTTLWNAGNSFGTFNSRTRRRGTSLQESDTSGSTEGEAHQVGKARRVGVNKSISVQPFHAIKKRRVPSSRTFVNKDEFLTKCMQAVHQQPRGHCVAKVPGKPAVFIRVPVVDPPYVSLRLRTLARDKMLAAPCYRKREDVEAEERARDEKAEDSPRPPRARRPIIPKK